MLQKCGSTSLPCAVARRPLLHCAHQAISFTKCDSKLQLTSFYEVMPNSGPHLDYEKKILSEESSYSQHIDFVASTTQSNISPERHSPKLKRFPLSLSPRRLTSSAIRANCCMRCEMSLHLFRPRRRCKDVPNVTVISSFFKNYFC